jgi:hypothetical protein
MSRKARSRPSWKKSRDRTPAETTVAFVPVPVHDPDALLHDLTLIDDQVLDDALRAPGVPTPSASVAVQQPS